MLYPKEDPENSVLMYACRTCQFSELAPTSCVYRHQESNTVGETAGVTQDVGSDPTVCGTHLLASKLESCTIVASDDKDAVDEELTPYYLCTLCGDEITCFNCTNN